MDKNNRTEGILGRISHELETQHKTQAELVAYLGLPVGTYTNWKLGRSRNFCEHIEAIAEYLNVDVGWLVTGEASTGAINQQEQELLETYRRLNAVKQEAVIQNMKSLDRMSLNILYSLEIQI